MRTNWSWDEYESWLQTIQSQRHTINLKVDFICHVRQLNSPHLHHLRPQHGYHGNHIRTLRHRKWRLSDWYSCLLFWRFRDRFSAENRISQVHSWLHSVTPDKCWGTEGPTLNKVAKTRHHSYPVSSLTSSGLESNSVNCDFGQKYTQICFSFKRY
jgi:hypothetical protein